MEDVLQCWILDGHTPVKVDGDTWYEWYMTSPDEHKVAMEWIGEVCVSTDFVGLGELSATVPTLMYQTIVFGGPLDRTATYHDTWDDALNINLFLSVGLNVRNNTPPRGG